MDYVNDLTLNRMRRATPVWSVSRSSLRLIIVRLSSSSIVLCMLGCELEAINTLAFEFMILLLSFKKSFRELWLSRCESSSFSWMWSYLLIVTKLMAVSSLCYSPLFCKSFSPPLFESLVSDVTSYPLLTLMSYFLSIWIK